MSDTSTEKRDSASAEVNPAQGNLGPKSPALKVTHADSDLAAGLTVDQVRGRGLKIGPIRLPAWRSPLAQVILVGFVCFLCPGMVCGLWQKPY
jgi:hypothetical protein